MGPDLLPDWHARTSPRSRGSCFPGRTSSRTGAGPVGTDGGPRPTDASTAAIAMDSRRVRRSPVGGPVPRWVRRRSGQLRSTSAASTIWLPWGGCLPPSSARPEVPRQRRQRRLLIVNPSRARWWPRRRRAGWRSTRCTWTSLTSTDSGEECEDAVAVGFDATVAIHPSQVPVIRAADRPSAERVDWAQRFLAHVGDDRGVTTFGTAWSTDRSTSKPSRCCDAQR